MRGVETREREEGGEGRGETNTISEGFTAELITVEPPNNGHIGDRSLVLCREVVPISEVVPERVWLCEIVTERALLGGG